MASKLEPYIDYREQGSCPIDREQIKKKWSLLNRILRYDRKYTLIEYSPSASKVRLKCVINKEDADWLIDELRLTEVRDPIFRKVAKYIR